MTSWAGTSPELIMDIELGDADDLVVLGLDNGWIVACYCNEFVCCDAATGAQWHVYTNTIRSFSQAIALGGNRIAIGADCGAVMLWNIPAVGTDGLERADVLLGHKTAILGMALQPNGKRLASWDAIDICIWDLQTLRCVDLFVHETLRLRPVFTNRGLMLPSDYDFEMMANGAVMKAEYPRMGIGVIHSASLVAPDEIILMGDCGVSCLRDNGTEWVVERQLLMSIPAHFSSIWLLSPDLMLGACRGQDTLFDLELGELHCRVEHTYCVLPDGRAVLRGGQQRQHTRLEVHAIDAFPVKLLEAAIERHRETRKRLAEELKTAEDKVSRMEEKLAKRCRTKDGTGQ